MPKSSPMQTSFASGEFSPLLNGNVDNPRYGQALAICLNYLPTVQNGITRRPGSKFVAEVKTSSKSTRLVSFEFSVTQAYILEFGDQYIRFYRNGGQILSGMSAYEISTPYLEADLFELKFTQSADVLYIVHPDYAPRTLSRTGHTSWTLATIDFSDGPYLDLNATTTTLTPAAATGTGVNLTASAITGINNDTGFQTTDVGRHVRIRDTSGNWGWAKIASRVSTTLVTIDIIEDLPGTSAYTFWHLGVWSDTTGYPAAVTFHEDRLAFAGAAETPQRIDLSESSDYESFAPSELDQSVIDSNGLSFSFNANDVNVVRWILSDAKGLIAGTVGGEWLVSPSSRGEALTPTNITAKRSSKHGSADIQALQSGNATIFIQRAGRKVREMNYFFERDKFISTDITLLAEHVTLGGLVQLTEISQPQPIIWGVRSDGVLIGCTYERDIDAFKVGWHRHIIGGTSDAAGTDAKVESIAAIPSQSGDRDELWMIVQRYVDGGVVRHIEYLTKIFDDAVEQKDAFFLDSALTYDDPQTISGVTKADPAVVTTSSAHGFNDGDRVLISGVKGMTELNTNAYLVANKTSTTFELTDLDGNDIDSSAFGTYVSGGEVRVYVSTISGLDHLEGETVHILGDGAVQPSQTVSSGEITLATDATTVHIGYNYNSDGQMLRLNAGAADGTAIGKTQRTHRMGIMLHRSLGLKIGTSFDDLIRLVFRKTSDSMGRAPALFTGILSEELEADYDFENQFCFRQDQPLPSTVLALMPQMHTQDR